MDVGPMHLQTYEMHTRGLNAHFTMGGLMDVSKLWPLLLTWFNFNPSMDK